MYKFITHSLLELVFGLPLLLKPPQAPGPSCLHRQAINALALASDDAPAALRTTLTRLLHSRKTQKTQERRVNTTLLGDNALF